MKLNILSNKIGWFGKYSGYELLPQYLTSQVNLSISSSKRHLAGKIINKLVRMKDKDFLGCEELLAESRFKRRINRNGLSHILYFEQHFNFFKKFEKRGENIIGTIHIPINYWEKENLKLLSKVSHAIVLYKEDIKKFSNYIAPDRIHFIKHGIDIHFFRPDFSKVSKNKVLFVGFFLRNFDMFLKVYMDLCKDIRSLEFHFVIPMHFRQSEVLHYLAKQNNVFFHQNLSDEELLTHYQDSNVLLMPMEDSGANTAIVQAIATGLPVITTDVGGIRSYGGGDVFPIVENNDHIGMIKLFKKYYFDSDFRNQISMKQREFAVTQLNWNLIGKEHVSVYDKISSQIKG